MKKRLFGLGVVLSLLAATAWWGWTRVTPPVTEAEARAYLDRIVAAALAGDLDKVCDFNGAVLNCERILRERGVRAALPSDPPTVTGTRYHPKDKGGTAGRVLVVEGRTSCGKPYRTEVFVFRENRFHFKAINAVYWSGFNVGASDVASPQKSPAPTCP